MRLECTLEECHGPITYRILVLIVILTMAVVDGGAVADAGNRGLVLEEALLEDEPGS